MATITLQRLIGVLVGAGAALAMMMSANNALDSAPSALGNAAHSAR